MFYTYRRTLPVAVMNRIEKGGGASASLGKFLANRRYVWRQQSLGQSAAGGAGSLGQWQDAVPRGGKELGRWWRGSRVDTRKIHTKLILGARHCLADRCIWNFDSYFLLLGIHCTVSRLTKIALSFIYYIFANHL